MAFEKYEGRRSGGGQSAYLTRNRFPICWLGKSTITFNAAALDLLGQDTQRVEIMWDSDERMFAFIPAPYGTRDSLKLVDEGRNEVSGVKRVGTSGLVKRFPELEALNGRAWRILPDQSEGYFAARFATQKELAEYDRNER